MSFGPKPWQQLHWDWRAAGNFMAGGAGAGLIVFAVPGGAHPLVLIAGLALIGVGLLCVWAEIGRPLRAINVFFNPITSWMTREGMVATVLMPVGLASAVLWPALAPLAALLALAFVYCQGRILHMSKGIPAWREPRVVPLIIATGLAEGAGLLMLVSPELFVQGWLLALAAAALLARLVLWAGYRKRLAARARAALAGAERGMVWGGTALPLALMVLAAAGWLPSLLLAAAGIAAAAAGAAFKFVLITRAAFNQGFALAQVPVRGVRR